MKKIGKKIKKIFVTLGILLGIGTLVSCYGMPVSPRMCQIQYILLEYDENGDLYYKVFTINGYSYTMTEEEYNENSDYYSQYLLDE